jgi:hypothetical protein
MEMDSAGELAIWSERSLLGVIWMSSAENAGSSEATSFRCGFDAS